MAQEGKEIQYVNMNLIFPFLHSSLSQGRPRHRAQHPERQRRAEGDRD